jgi:protein gp37
MSSQTGIEWTDATWNPLRGCSPVSAGCKNCYASRDAKRFSGPDAPFEGLVRINAAGERTDEWNGQVHFIEKHLLDPLKWKPIKEQTEPEEMAGIFHTRPRRIFVNSVSDLFHENVPDDWIDRIFAVMALCPQHIFQVLTKRPERMLRWFKSGPRPSTMTCPRRNHILNVTDFMTRAGEIAEKYRGLEIALAARLVHGEWKWPLPNVWLGVSVENQAAADERIPLLLQTPAAVRFVSCEPLLGPVRLDRIGEEPEGYLNALAAVVHCDGRGTKSITGLDWVICGGESGPGARPMHPDWARNLRDQCKAVGVPFFFKQWGEWAPCENGEVTPNPQDWDTPPPTHEFHGDDRPRCAQEVVYRIGKKAAGSLLDGREWKQFPE